MGCQSRNRNRGRIIENAAKVLILLLQDPDAGPSQVADALGSSKRTGYRYLKSIEGVFDKMNLHPNEFRGAETGTGLEVPGPVDPGHGPCFTCIRKDEDKQKCCRICDRLDAYQHGNEWADIPIPTEEEIEACKAPREEEDTRMEYQCLICDKAKKIKAAGLCHSCHAKWRQGEFDHPELGPWKKKPAPAPKKKKDRLLADPERQELEELRAEARELRRGIESQKETIALLDKTNTGLNRLINELRIKADAFDMLRRVGAEKRTGL